MRSAVVLGSLEPTDERPVTRVRQAGDRQVLVEYGEIEVDLRLNFRVHALLRQLEQHPFAGLVAAAPGFRSLLVTFDPAQVGRDAVVKELLDRERAAPDLSSLVLPSRIVTMPIAFDDEMTREAVHRYRITTRQDAPNVRDGDNIDYIVRYNGFADRDAFFDCFLAATWWNAFIGYFPGLPSLFSMDPLTQISVPKYNPARMWTAEGAVGIGGPCVVAYPIASPGSYQLFGRTLPLVDIGHAGGPRGGAHHATSAVDEAAASHLFVLGDRVRFQRVGEEELLRLRMQVFEGRYEYQIETDEFRVCQYQAELERLAPKVAEVARQRAAAASSVEVP